MKKSRLEPFEILAANKRSNPLLASGEAEAESEPKRVRKRPAETVPSSRQQDAQDRTDSSPPAGWFGRGIVRRSLLTLRGTPLRLAVISFLVIAAAGLAFLGGMRAGSSPKELPLPQQPPAGSFDEIRRNRVVLFDDLEVDRGPLRR